MLGVTDKYTIRPVETEVTLKLEHQAFFCFLSFVCVCVSFSFFNIFKLSTRNSYFFVTEVKRKTSGRGENFKGDKIKSQNSLKLPLALKGLIFFPNNKGENSV